MDITKIDEQDAILDAKFNVEALIRVTIKCFNDAGFKRVVLYFNKNVTLVVPEGANVCCDITKAACECTQSDNVSCNSNYINMACCTVKIAVVVKSKKLVQIEVPFLGSCEPKQLCPVPL